MEPASPGEGPPMMEVSSEFLTGQQIQLHFGCGVAGGGSGKRAAPALGAWHEDCSSPSIRAAFPGQRPALQPQQQPAVYQTFGQLSLADSPVKQAPPPLPRPSSHETAVPGPDPYVAQLEQVNAELVQELRELQERLAAAEAAAAAAAAAASTASPSPLMHGHSDEREVRELQDRLAARGREAAAAHEAVDRARAEAKAAAAQLEAERSRAASLLDEAAQWKDEAHKARKECAAQQKKIEALSAAGGLADGAAGALRKQNAELLAALAERDAADKAAQEQLAALQGQEAARQRQLQQLLSQIEELERANAELLQQLQEASADELARQRHMQQLWEERERLLSENVSLRRQTQDLAAELQHVGDAFAATRSQLQGLQLGSSASLAGGSSSMAGERPVTDARPAGYAAGHQGQARQWDQQRGPRSSFAYQEQEPAATQPSFGGGRRESEVYGGPQPLADWQLPQQVQQRYSVLAVPPETAAVQESWGAAALAPAPPAQRSLSFDSLGEGGDAGGAPPISPLEPSGYNPRASLPQPFAHLTHSFRASLTPEGSHQLQGGALASSSGGGGISGSSRAALGAEGSNTPGGEGGPSASGRGGKRSSGSEAAPQPSPLALDSALKAQRAAGIPYGNEETLQEMLARTQALEDRLMRLGLERNDLEAEFARLPTTGKTVQERRRKTEVEARLGVVTKEISAIRLQLKKMGYK